MNNNDANVIFSTANVEKVTKFKLEGGAVDFGDHAHLFGTPQGTAIVAWSIDGRVAVQGILFSDNFRDPQVATSRIRFRRTNGTWTSWRTNSVASQGGLMTWWDSTFVQRISPVGQFNRVQIELSSSMNTDLGPLDTVHKTKNFNR